MHIVTDGGIDTSCDHEFSPTPSVPTMQGYLKGKIRDCVIEAGGPSIANNDIVIFGGPA